MADTLADTIGMLQSLNELNSEDQSSLNEIKEWTEGFIAGWANIAEITGSTPPELERATMMLGAVDGLIGLTAALGAEITLVLDQFQGMVND